MQKGRIPKESALSAWPHPGRKKECGVRGREDQGLSGLSTLVVGQGTTLVTSELAVTRPKT